MKYTWSCHCWKVAYEIESPEIQKWMMCNCSYCSRKWFILHFLPETNFTLTAWKDALTEYKFNKKQIKHLFCKHCGVQCFWEWTSPDGTPTIAINLNTVENIDLENISINKFDGKSL